MNDDRLWAPWRLAYVQGQPESDQPLSEPAEWLPGAETSCFICRAAARQHDQQADRANLVLLRDRGVVTLLNRFPYSNGHLLVCPARHVADLGDMTNDEYCVVTQTQARLVDILRSTIHAQGFNIGLNLGRLAGAGVPGHLHWHIVPRWEGDHNFMSTAAGTRVIPQALDDAWQLFTSALGDTTA